MRYILKPLALATCIGMLIVLLMGVLVTRTGSQQGCGDDWPLCNGKFIPSYTIESLVEYNHRAVTGLEGILVLAVFVGVWRYARRTDAKLYASSTAFFTVLQAVMGALAVVMQQSSAVKALHFGFSLLAFASSYMLYRVFVENDPLADPAAHETGEENKTSGRAAIGTPPGGSGVCAVPRKLAWLFLFTAVYCYVVVYLGAYVKHTDSSGACSGWPLCNGEIVPELSGGAGIVFVHRVAAALLFILIGFMYYAVRRASVDPRIQKSAAMALWLVALQVASGAFVAYAIGSEWYLLAGVLHTVIVSALFASLCHLCAFLVPERIMMGGGSRKLQAGGLNA